MIACLIYHFFNSAFNCFVFENVMKCFSLKYCGSVISHNGEVPSLDKIDHCFGATHPGVYDAVNQMFELKFRGLQFQFPADPNLISSQMTGLGAIQFSEPPLVSNANKIKLLFQYSLLIDELIVVSAIRGRIYENLSGLPEHSMSI